MANKSESAKKRQLLQLEQHLQHVVFAQDADVIDRLNHADTSASVQEQGANDPGPKSAKWKSDQSAYQDVSHDFWQRHQTSDPGSDTSDDDELQHNKSVIKPKAAPVDDEGKEDAAWTDSDDEISAGQGLQNTATLPKKVTADQKFKSYQEQKFTSLVKRPKWADGVKRTESDDEEHDSLSKVAGKLVKKKYCLSRSNLVFNKCTALNADLTRSFGYNSVQFHPKYEIGIVADRKVVDFFKLEDQGKESENRTIKSYEFSDSQIERMRITTDGRQVIIGTIYPDSSTHAIDLVSGKTLTFSLMRGSESIGLRGMSLSADGSLIACRSENGRILIMDAKVKEFIRSVKMNDDVKCVCFSADSKHLFSHGAGGQVYVWDVKQEKLVHKFYDEGAVTGSALTASPNGQFLATGSESGVVNVYNLKTCMQEQAPKPLKSLMNLTTEISSISFNHSSELFSFCSRFKHNAVRLTHVPSRSVYSNFPYQEDSYGRVGEMQFSPASGFAAMTTNQKSVNLFRLCHFAGY